MMVESLTAGSVVVSYMDGKQTQYDDVTNVSLSRDWAFIKFDDGGRVQIPVTMIRELCEEDTVFVKGVKSEI